MRKLPNPRERFPVDPSVKGKIGGTAPEGHPRRCQGVNNFGQQCKVYATKGRRFCRFHGGKTPLLRTSIMGRYSRAVSTPLAERLKELSEEGPARLDLGDEVDLSRVLTERTLKMYDLVVVQGATNKEGEPATPEQKALAVSALRTALDSTAALVEKMARINNSTKDKVTIEQIAFVVAQIGKALEAEIQDEELRARILERIKNIDIPNDVNLVPRVSFEW